MCLLRRADDVILRSSRGGADDVILRFLRGRADGVSLRSYGGGWLP